MAADSQIKVIQMAIKRRKLALRLKKKGKTLQEIAEALGVTSRQRAGQIVQRAIDEERLASQKAAKG